MKFSYAQRSTPFNLDDASQLLPRHITTQSQLNEWEQANIIKAERWLFARKRQKIITTDFCRTLHQKMFDETWLWAGKLRQRQTNIGVQPHLISEALKTLCDDVLYWIRHNVFPIDEIAARFHHRLMTIHLFSNGNGRHARLMADGLLFQYHARRFSWGKTNLGPASETRDLYIRALRQADQENYQQLFEFVRT